MSFRKILFLAEGQLGDLLLLTPALRAVKESFPSSSVSVLVVERRNPDKSKTKWFSDLTATAAERAISPLSTNTNVDELLVINRQTLRSLKGLARVKAELDIVRFLRRQKFDTVICTFPEDRFAEWAFASGARMRVGQRKQNLHWLLTHTPAIEKAEKGVLEYYCDLVRAIGAQVQSMHTEYNIPPSSVGWADNFLKANNISTSQKLVAVHPGATGNYKIWPPERYAALMEFLLSVPETKVLLLVRDFDLPIISAIKRNLRSAVIEIETGDNVGNLAAILRRCVLCISNDSGPRHLAIAVGTRSLAFFRQHHDREWGVYEENDRVMTLKSSQPCPVCPPGICMDKIPPDEMFSSYCMRIVGVDESIACAEGIIHRSE